LLGKAITARYTALELISKREQIRNEMKDHLKEALQPYKIIVDDFSVVNFKWDADFQKAIDLNLMSTINLVYAFCRA
jgi:membrane protease subunit (stomatin/prohibitin family)